MEIFQRFWKRLWAIRPRKPKTFKHVFVDDVPEHLTENEIYLVGEDKNPWCTVFICPCGCAETIHLSNVAEDSPRWEISFHRGNTISLRPSIRRLRNCKAHFFIRKGIAVMIPKEWDYEADRAW